MLVQCECMFQWVPLFCCFSSGAIWRCVFETIFDMRKCVDMMSNLFFGLKAVLWKPMIMIIISHPLLNGIGEKRKILYEL